MKKRLFGDIEYNPKSNMWVLNNIEPHVMIRLKTIFKRIPKSKVCPVYINHIQEDSLDLYWFLQRYPLRISDKDLKFLESQRQKQIDLNSKVEEFFHPDYKPQNYPLKKPLREYQALAVDFFNSVRRCLIGDVTGLGKTPLAIATLLDPNKRPALVTMQTHMPDQWAEKFQEFSDLKVHIIRTGKQYQLPPADVYICSYSKLAKWVDILSNGFIKTFICDEIQEFRKNDSDKYQAGKAIANSCDFVLGLSATPIYNYGDEAWNIFNLIKEGCLDTKENFIREWCKDGQIVADPKALGTFLRENNLFLRRTRPEVGRELPPLTKIIEKVDFDEGALKSIEDIAKQLSIKVMQGSFVERGKASRDLDMLVRQATGISKAKFVADYVRMIVEAGEPVLLAGWHRRVFDIWQERLADLSPVMYTGTESPKQKEETKKKFISGESNLMFISLRSGVGLDGLQERCSIVVLGELDWSPKVHEQIIGRIDRDRADGINNHVTAIFLTTDSGSDPAIIDMLGLKASQASGITDPLASIDVVNIDDSRIKKIAKAYLDKKSKESNLLENEVGNNLEEIKKEAP